MTREASPSTAGLDELPSEERLVAASERVIAATFGQTVDGKQLADLWDAVLQYADNDQDQARTSINAASKALNFDLDPECLNDLLRAAPRHRRNICRIQSVWHCFPRALSLYPIGSLSERLVQELVFLAQTQCGREEACKLLNAAVSERLFARPSTKPQLKREDIRTARIKAEKLLQAGVIQVSSQNLNKRKPPRISPRSHLSSRASTPAGSRAETPPVDPQLDSHNDTGGAREGKPSSPGSVIQIEKQPTSQPVTSASARGRQDIEEQGRTRTPPHSPERHRTPSRPSSQHEEGGCNDGPESPPKPEAGRNHQGRELQDTPGSARYNFGDDDDYNLGDDNSGLQPAADEGGNSLDQSFPDLLRFYEQHRHQLQQQPARSIEEALYTSKPPPTSNPPPPTTNSPPPPPPLQEQSSRPPSEPQPLSTMVETGDKAGPQQEDTSKDFETDLAQLKEQWGKITYDMLWRVRDFSTVLHGHGDKARAVRQQMGESAEQRRQQHASAQREVEGFKQRLSVAREECLARKTEANEAFKRISAGRLLTTEGNEHEADNGEDEDDEEQQGFRDASVEAHRRHMAAKGAVQEAEAALLEAERLAAEADAKTSEAAGQHLEEDYELLQAEVHSTLSILGEVAHPGPKQPENRKRPCHRR